MTTATSQPAGFAAGLTAGLARMARSAREADLPDPIEIARAVDLAGRVEVGRELATDAAATVAERVTGAQARRRGSRRRRLLTALAVGLVLATTMTAWRTWRRMSERASRERTLDRMAVDRAAGEGMGTTIGSRASQPYPERIAVAMDMAAAEEPAATTEPVSPSSHAASAGDPATDDIRGERLGRTVIDQSKVGIGVPRA